MSIQVRWRASAVAITLGASAVAAASAQAADTYRVVGTGGTLHVHPAPSLGSPVIGNLPDGTAIHIACQQRGDNVIRSSMWDRIDQPVSGWIADWYTTTPVVNSYSPGFKDCLDVGPPQGDGNPVPVPDPTPQPIPVPAPSPTPVRDLASVAQSYVGQTKVPAAVPRSWGLGTYWSGHCEGFVGWVTAGSRGRPYGSAIADYRGHRGSIHTGVPPRNTVVYWNPPGSVYGHIGISIGGGQVVSTIGFGRGHEAIAQHGYRFFGNYLGWANP